MMASTPGGLSLLLINSMSWQTCKRETLWALVQRELDRSLAWGCQYISSFNCYSLASYLLSSSINQMRIRLSKKGQLKILLFSKKCYPSLFQHGEKLITNIWECIRGTWTIYNSLIQNYRVWLGHQLRNTLEASLR